MTLFHYHLVFILDTWDNVFIWLGNESSNSEQEAVQDLAKEYLASSPSKRKGNGLDFQINALSFSLNSGKIAESRLGMRHLNL